MSTAYPIPAAPVKPTNVSKPAGDIENRHKSRTGVCDGGFDVLEKLGAGLELWGYFKPDNLRDPAYYLVVEKDVPAGCSCPDFLRRADANPLHVCKHLRDLRSYLLPGAGINPSLAALFPVDTVRPAGQKAMFI